MKSSWTGGLPVCQTVFLVFLSLLWTGSLAAQEVFYRFEAPCFVTGPPGATRTFEAVVVMDSRFPPGTPGSEGWTVSLTADGGVVTGVTQRAFVVPTNSGDLQLAQTSFQVAGDGAFPDGRRGGFAVVTLSFAKDIYVLPRAVARIARVNVQTTIPAGGECGSVTLRFEDGVVGRGQPVPNAITRRGMTVIPGLEGKEVPVCPDPSTVSCPDPHLLQVGSPVAFVLTPSDAVRICKLNVAASGGIVSFSFTDPRASHWNILRGRWGAPPTNAIYDKAAVGRQATQRLVMPLDRTGDLFVMVQGNIDLGRFHQGTLLATREELAVERMSSSFSSNAEGEEVRLIFDHAVESLGEMRDREGRCLFEDFKGTLATVGELRA
ncbi:MAG: hypothetical protein O7J95_13190, partial [Planctomycetota bacterium]|nr:hypothetical protein [Planctomycetota bacterium]